MKYPKVPKAGPHIAYALCLALLVSFLFYFINPALPVDDATSRWISRCGATFLVLGAVLGYFGLIWSKQNKQKLRDAQNEIANCTEVASILMAKKQTTAIAGELASYNKRMQVAHLATKEASNFDQTVATVTFAALHFLVVGTILQAIAA